VSTARPWSRLSSVLVLLLLGGCGGALTLPPNPFRTTPSIVVTASPSPSPVPVTPTETPEPFKPYWVKNHRQTEIWSGQRGQPGVISFGTTSDQFCVFQVVQPQDGPRLFVLNPFSRDHFWIDADAVGPIAEAPPRASGPKPSDQNCADRLYDP
jgi:hypothetical protein